MGQREDAIETRWVAPLREFLPAFLAKQPVPAGEGALLLSGSTTIGVDDALADLDVWLLLDEQAIAEIDRRSPTRFFEFRVPALENRKGHVKAESLTYFERRVDGCDFPLIAELRTARIISDPERYAAVILERAKQPMRDEVRLAWFCYHYVEMRGEHRACDNPIDRGDATAILLALSKALEQALQAACVLDRQPYRYSKWLAREARKTPTGARVAELVEAVVDQLGAAALRIPGPEAMHPLNLTLRKIRAVLIESAEREGIDGAWLREWWLYINQARAGVGGVRW